MNPAPAVEATHAKRDTSHDQPEEPIGAYLGLAGTFATISSLGALWLLRSRWRIPKPELTDLALLGFATARLSRLITRERVMRPLRAPFTELDPAVQNAAHERPRGSGLVRAVGELVTCPRCTAVWAATALALVYFAAPRAGRFVTLLLSSALISDFTNRKLAQGSGQ